MIQLVDRAVEQFFRKAVPLPENSVDVSFDAPDKTWGASITRPTVNIFLWAVTRNPAFAQAGLIQRVGAEGRVERRPTSPVVDLHYLVTAWATEQRDEHQLLGSILTSVLGNSVLPVDSLPEQLAGTSWITMSLSTREKGSPGEFWSALDGRLKPGLQLELSLPLDVFTWEQAGAPVESVVVAMEQMPTSPSPGPDPLPPLHRRRANGALVMEGRVPQPPDATA